MAADALGAAPPLRGAYAEGVSARRDRWILLANGLSLSRVPLAGLLWIMPRSPWWVLSIVAIAGLTDVLDGWVVRRGKAKAWADGDRGALAATVARGEVIDGFADKVFVVSTVACLLFVEQPPWWVAGALVARELTMLPAVIVWRLAPAAFRERVSFTAGPIGKAATAAQFAAIVLGFLDHALFVHVAVVAGLLGFVSTVYYVGRPFFRRDAAPAGG